MRKKILLALILLFELSFSITAHVSALKEQLYLDTYNEVIWARGVNNIKVNGKDSEFKCDPVDHGALVFHEYYSEFDPTKGYFDINKSEDRDKDAYLCFAVSASNALTWWFRENESLINTYLEQNPDASFAKEIKDFQILPTSQYDSKIFAHFVNQYAYRREGYWPDILIDHFLNGYKPKENGGVNDQDWDGDILLENGPARGGGYFFDLLGKNRLSNRTLPSYTEFSDLVKNSLSNDSLIMMTYDMVTYAHVVTLWGGEFDSDGNLCAVYYSDSDDDKMYGLKRVRVINKGGFPYLTTEINNKSSSLISAVSTISLGQKFFGVHEHEYGEPVWNYSDLNNVTATFTCLTDSSHKEVLKANVETKLIDSTCFKEGTSYKIANVDFNGKTYTSNRFDIKNIQIKEHQFTEFEVYLAATCITEGKKRRTCKLCGHEEIETIPKLEHISDDIYHYENGHHYNLCKYGCNTKLNYSSCTGGKATINQGAFCDICHNEYSAKIPNNELLNVGSTLIDENTKNLIYNFNSSKNLIEIRLNNQVIDSKNYVVNDNSITINADYLETITKDDVITLQFDDGYVNIHYEINKDNVTNDNNETNNNNLIIWVSVVVGILLLVVISFFIIKRNTK